MNPAAIIRGALDAIDAEDARHRDILWTAVENDIRARRRKAEYGEHSVPIGNAHAIARHPVSCVESIPTMKDVPIETRRAALAEIHPAVHFALDDDETDSD